MPQRRPMPELELKPDETLLQEWRPKLSVFLRKLVFVGVLTAFFLSGFDFMMTIHLWLDGFPLSNAIRYGIGDIDFIWLLVLPVPMAFYIFIFDDHMEWFRHRKDAWQLTNQRLIFRNNIYDEDTAEIDLTEIRRVRLWMWWSLKISLSNGRTLMLKFLPRRKDVRDAIANAQAQCLEAANG